MSEHIAESTANIPSIKKLEILVTDDELADILSRHKESENIMLVAVMPSYSGFGEEDDAGVISYLQFFVLEKVDYTKFKNKDEYLAVFERTLSVARDFVINMFLLEDVNCSLEQLQYDYQIRPISRKAGCNGYEIQIDSKAYIDNY